MEPSAWKYSTTAQAYYWSLWDKAGFDFNLQGAKNEVEKIKKIWLYTGVDGFMWDVGDTNPIIKYLFIDMPKTYTTNDKWLTFENADSSD